ncbi:MAG: DNA polymerase IV [Acholeplasmatales bacterium]|jgi:DNA polymerase-4|nr:DNA polymerase IV [Acholeplasmatales bacterium]
MIQNKPEIKKNKNKVIFHIDLNQFFCSCAIIKEPYLKGKKIAVGGDAILQKGIISTASYEARKFGVHSAMSVKDALNLVPDLIVVPIDFSLYIKKSKQFFKLLSEYTEFLVEGSIDEGYLDITKLSEARSPLEIAKEIQDRLLNEYNLPCSIGISFTLFLAKMASDLKKPLGITLIRKNDIIPSIYSLPIEDMFGIGKKTYPILKEMGINKIGDFTKESNKDKILSIMSYDLYQSYLNCLLGKSSNIVDPSKYSIPKSISTETTLNGIVSDFETILSAIKTLYERVHKQLCGYGMLGKTFGLKFKDANFKSITRSKTSTFYTNDYDNGLRMLTNILEEYYNDQEIKLVGVYISNLINKQDLKDEEYNLFTYEKILRRLGLF